MLEDFVKDVDSKQVLQSWLQPSPAVTLTLALQGVGLPADDYRPPQPPKRLRWLRSLRVFAGGERGGLQGYLKAYRGIWSWVSLHLSPTRIYPSRPSDIDHSRTERALRVLL